MDKPTDEQLKYAKEQKEKHLREQKLIEEARGTNWSRSGYRVPQKVEPGGDSVHTWREFRDFNGGGKKSKKRKRSAKSLKKKRKSYKKSKCSKRKINRNKRSKSKRSIKSRRYFKMSLTR
jgi:hypothetical protein